MQIRTSAPEGYQNLWTAIDDNIYDGAPDAGPQCVGYGSTEQEAIDDLLFQLEEAEIY